MTKLRRLSKNSNSRFHAFVVEPSPGFKPKNWRQNPQHYRIVSYVGPKEFRGAADAWKFLFNHEALGRGDQTRWAICLDFDKPILNPIARRDLGNAESNAVRNRIDQNTLIEANAQKTLKTGQTLS